MTKLNAVPHTESDTVLRQAALACGLTIGQLLMGRYETRRVLGRGAMGEVLEVRDRHSGNDYALKRIPPDLSRDSAQMASVRDNFRLVSQLTHPHICTARQIEIDQETGHAYILMDLVRGINLLEWIMNKRRELGIPNAPIPMDLVLGIATQVAEALDYAHNLAISHVANGQPKLYGVLHRDLKPANIMLESDRECHTGVPFVRLIDFGLAAEIQASLQSMSVRRSNELSGTPVYMAPEQWEGRTLTRGVDQWALAVIMYEMLAGRRPFDGPTQTAIMHQICKADPEAPEALSPTQWAVLKKTFQADRKQRHVSCLALVKALAQASNTETLNGEISEVIVSDDERFEEPRYALPQQVRRIAPVESNEPKALVDSRGQVASPSIDRPRRNYARRNHVGTLIAAFLLCSFGVGGYFGWAWWSEKQQIAEVRHEDACKAEAKRWADESEANRVAEEKRKNDELYHAQVNSSLFLPASKAEFSSAHGIEAKRIAEAPHKTTEFEVARLVKEKQSAEEATRNMKTVADDEAWKTAQQTLQNDGENLSKTKNACEEYLSAYANGSHATEAREKLADIKQAEDVRDALSAAIHAAVEAKKNGEWEQVKTALEKPLAILGNRDHLNKDLARQLLAQAQVEQKKRVDFAAQIESANAFLTANAHTEAKTAFEEARRIWPEAPAPEARKIEDGLRAVENSLKERRFQAAMSAGFAALEAQNWKIAEDCYKNALKEKSNDRVAQNGLSDAQAGAERQRQAEDYARAKTMPRAVENPAFATEKKIENLNRAQSSERNETDAYQLLGTFIVYANIRCQGIPLGKRGKIIPLTLDFDKEQREEALQKRKNWWRVKKGTKVKIKASGAWLIGPVQRYCGPDGVRRDDGKPSERSDRAFVGPDKSFTVGMLVAFIDDRESVAWESEFKEIENANAVWAYSGDSLEFTATKDGVLRFQQNRYGSMDMASGALEVTVWFNEPPAK